ncbi:MAG: DUF1697 domain-containing protein [Methanobacteriaceae archaeon]|jgi:uncharacterized protein (DUF1697 family)|nr:DUF1697 domain-containing protein [Methanobacteriaceae archaeon]MDP2837627.1 DUF1697 domain-containing protein [Methanobacteriaceae archaeon]MDP3035796.1 DUF1697 domain-containing protein [Methanobacteriaceae archaeon]MDP3486065.1 DUF1697 domain-containing protein [Methanobacteriaceae archaeon]MDP3624391.1 DUF1697 domain-containing protein [Methanobacteriaceae archaeon]
MVQYVALLRGITPSNSNMHNNKLRSLFEDIGFQNVQTVLSSGNVIFESQVSNTSEIEDIIEKSLPKQLNFTSTTIVLSRDELQSMVNSEPFNGRRDTSQYKLNVTFLKNKPNNNIEFPYHFENNGFILLGMRENAIYSIVDLTKTKTPNLMRWMEKEFDKNLTTRTWRTVNRILKRLDET